MLATQHQVMSSNCKRPKKTAKTLKVNEVTTVVKAISSPKEDLSTEILFELKSSRFV